MNTETKVMLILNQTPSKTTNKLTPKFSNCKPYTHWQNESVSKSCVTAQHCSQEIFFPLSENSGGHDHEHMEDEVCKTLKYSYCCYCYCVILFAMLIAMIAYDTYITPGALIIWSNVLQPTPVGNGADDENKRTLFRQFSDKVMSVCLILGSECTMQCSLIIARPNKCRVQKWTLGGTIDHSFFPMKSIYSGRQLRPHLVLSQCIDKKTCMFEFCFPSLTWYDKFHKIQRQQAMTGRGPTCRPSPSIINQIATRIYDYNHLIWRSGHFNRQKLCIVSKPTLKK